ncbi:MAG: M64 family metallopeptidase [Candidatus Glassbacteria bacterium]
MKLLCMVILACGLTVNLLPESLWAYDEYFEDGAMRVDYYHTGSAGGEIISIDRVYLEEQWGGSKINLIDTTDLGKYMVRVYDLRTNQLIFSRGFSSIYGEWETTSEASEGTSRTFHESAVFPFPKESIQFVIAKRNRRNNFEEIFSCVIDPGSDEVNREYHGRGYKANKYIYHGDPSEKVDVVIMGDGYTALELPEFHEDVKRLTGALFESSPFKERKDDFNVWTIDVVSRDSGIDEPTKGLWRDTALGTSFNSLGTPRYVLTLENEAVRDIASNAPYDQIYILLNTDRYGGGGIFNFYSTCITQAEKEVNSWWPEYVFVHEFGHSFAGLGDEYYSSSVAYSDFFPEGVEPWEPNITALTSVEKLKWSGYVEEKTPLPTPWNKARYDSLGAVRRELDRDSEDYDEEMRRLEKERLEMLASEDYAGKVGAFEGAGYASIGLYRPFLDCRMFSKSLTPFCPVCEEAINRVIDFHTNK